MIKVSVIIPAYNDGKYLAECLDSVISQTYEDLEVICVDDASTDASYALINEYLERDNRIKCVRNAENLGAFISRKRGVDLARGEYILFVDADDALGMELIDELMNRAGKSDYDIVQFSTNVVNCGISAESEKSMRDFTIPYDGILHDKDIFVKCFLESAYGFNIWNKIYKSSLCKRVFAQTDDLWASKAEDVLIYFLLAANARTYMGFYSDAKYIYNFGRGGTGKKKLDAGDYNRLCRYDLIMESMRKASTGDIPEEDKAEAIERLKTRFIYESIELLLISVIKKERAQAFNKLFYLWPLEELIAGFCDGFWNCREELIDCINESGILSENKAISRRIAFYYPKYGRGGVERVISLLAPLYLSRGYEVILITEEEPQEDDYFLPEQIRRYSITKWYDITERRKPYIQRAQELSRILEGEEIDTVCYHAASNQLLLYDLMLIKLTGRRLILSKHELYSQHMSFNEDFLSAEMDVYPLVDRLVVLSHEEESFWRALGVNSVYIPNPINKQISAEFKYNIESNEIIWVGRLDRNQKQYQYIVPIMEAILQQRPDAVMRIYGSPETFQDGILLKKQIEEAGIGKNTIYEGYVPEITEIYKNAAILLVTSAYESYPMNILESKQFGIPLVNFDMPYLEMLKGGRGNIAVPQGNITAAAEAVIGLLSDKEYRSRLSKEAKEDVDLHINRSIMQKWNAIFMQRDKYVKPHLNKYGSIIRTMVFHQSLGCKKHERLAKKYREAVERLKLFELRELQNERGLKLALYPFGMLGEFLRKMLINKGFDVDLIIDNKRKEENLRIVTLEELKNIEVDEYLFLISSDNVRYYEEIRDRIKAVVPEDNIYDWCPIEE